jgi:hypothetical protein
MSAGTRRSAHNDSGAAAVEMALVLPLLLLVVFGIIDFGRMLNAQIILTQAAREGARAQALGVPPGPPVAAASKGIAGPGSVSVDPGPSCPSGPGAAGANATVKASYDFDFITPVGDIGAAFFGGSNAGSTTLTGEGVMPCAR